jgi:hypothetical protein
MVNLDKWASAISQEIISQEIIGKLRAEMKKRGHLIRRARLPGPGREPGTTVVLQNKTTYGNFLSAKARPMLSIGAGAR